MNWLRRSAPEIKFALTLTLTIWCLVLPALYMNGCRAVPPQSTNPRVIFAATILDASTAVDDLSVALVAANTGVSNLRASEPEYYAEIHPYLARIAVANDKAIAAIRAVKAGDTSTNWRKALQDVVAAAASLDPTVFGFKNPSSQATVKILFASFSAAISAIDVSFVNQAQGGKP